MRQTLRSWVLQLHAINAANVIHSPSSSAPLADFLRQPCPSVSSVRVFRVRSTTPSTRTKPTVSESELSHFAPETLGCLKHSDGLEHVRGAEVGEDLLGGVSGGHRGGVDHQLRMLGRLVGRVDTGEVGQFAATCLGVETLRVALLG